MFRIDCTLTLKLMQYIELPFAVKVASHSVQFISSKGAGAAFNNKHTQL